MPVLGIDLGGTKLLLCIFTEEGSIVHKETAVLGSRQGSEVGALITEKVSELALTESIRSIGISVPGISRSKTGTVWAPNIPGWSDYPLLKEVREVVGNIPVTMDSDRSCYILGELWKGNAQGCTDAIYLSVGTGIGAGILVNGHVLRGAHDIAGAVGWMALSRHFKEEFTSCGCFEHYASGEGIAKVARELVDEQEDYKGELNDTLKITSQQIFAAYENRDPVAMRVIESCIELWGAAVANLVSIFNPEKIILGGGVFGPGLQFIDAIKSEATKWGQPISMSLVSLEPSALGGDAGVYGAGFLALKNVLPDNTQLK